MQLLLCTVKWFKVQTNGEFDWKGFDKDQRFESDTTWKCQRRKTQKEAKPWPSRWAFQDQPPPPTEIKSKVGCVGICSVWRRWTFSSSYAHFQAFFFSGGPGCGRCGVRRSVWRCLKAKNLSCLLLLLHDLFSVRRHNKSIFWGLIEPRRVFFSVRHYWLLWRSRLTIWWCERHSMWKPRLVRFSIDFEFVEAS